TCFNYIDFHIYDAFHQSDMGKVLGFQSIERTNFALEIGASSNTVEVNTRGLSVEWSRRVADYFMRALRDIAGDVHAPIVIETLLSEADRNLLLRRPPPGALIEHQDVVDAFRARSRGDSSAAAVLRDDGVVITYGALDHRSDSLAARLWAAGVRPGDIVAVIGNRSVDAVVGVLGILKTGSAYLPIDPALPSPRVPAMLH